MKQEGNGGDTVTNMSGSHEFFIENTHRKQRQEIFVQYVFATVPTPGTFALLGLGGLVGVRCRR